MIFTSGLLLSLGLAGLTAASPAKDYKPECEPRTLCIDGINDCGQRWGGCYDTCKPETKPTMPPCEPESTEDPDLPEFCDDGEERILCIDYINECGMMYGGCHDVCSLPTPVYTPPPCPTSATLATVVRTKTTPTTTAGPCEDDEPLTICADGIDECGNGWGTCWDYCATPTMPPMDNPDCTPTADPTPVEFEY